MDDPRVDTYTRGAERLHIVRRRRRRHWSLRLVIALIVVAVIVTYVIYMLLGMPGMDHTPTGGARPTSRALPPIAATADT